jgi:hypothetical protein
MRTVTIRRLPSMEKTAQVAPCYAPPATTDVRVMDVLTPPHAATPDVIAAHPNFGAARAAYIRSVMDLYEGKPSEIELMLDGGRILVFGIVMCLWGAYRPEYRESWPTVSRVKASLALFGLVGSRQIDALLGRLAQTGYLTLDRTPGDARSRLVLPTPRMIEHDLDWLRAHYRAHATLFGEAAYALPLARDAAYQRAVHAAAVQTFSAAAENVVEQNLTILLFLSRSAGLLILMKLIQQAGGGTDAIPVSYSDLGARFGVSRTHVRDLLSAAAAAGRVVLDPPGAVRLTPGLLQAFDRHLANGMSLQDVGHHAAMLSLASDGARTATA